MVALKDPLTNPDGSVVDRKEDWSRAYPVDSQLHFAKALLAVLFSFDGWENATFVVGELPRNREQRELRKGFYWAVFTVGCTYVIIVGVVLNSLTWDGINTVNVYYAPLLTGNGSAAKPSWSIVGAISALGSLNSVIYTFSRVKQLIGQANILPWSNVWKKDDVLQRDPKGIIADDTVDNSMKKTPQGGLILHWALTVAVIAGSSWISSTVESVQVPGLIQAYAHCFILMVLGCTYHRLQSREAALTPPTSGPMTNPTTTSHGRFQPYKWNHTALRIVRFIFVAAFVLLNFAILVINVIPPYKGSDGTPYFFPGYLVIVVVLVLFSVIYYITIFGAAKRIYPSSNNRDTATRIETQGLLEPNNKMNLLRLANVTCEIEKDRYYNPSLERVYRFGRRWRIRWYVPGDRPQPVPATQNGYANGVARTASAAAANREPHPPLTWATFLYWVLGGGRLFDPPDKKFGRWWDRYVGL
ncbi:amino acid permease-domain-containing protein [Rhypophila decipiens]|uniref:Amino acid permease-domain-containing protein n=1 Tax=Rhypophila decipiens TaxID=261697 RepID=A0AAN6Y0J7_9PEZI|nr:amino acid permease-domain-containing protein [Rhypophila decipiens]